MNYITIKGVDTSDLNQMIREINAVGNLMDLQDQIESCETLIHKCIPTVDSEFLESDLDNIYDLIHALRQMITQC